MKLRLLLLTFSVICSMACSAQIGDFFKPLPKPASAAVGHGKFTLSKDSTMNTIRPVANLASYGFSHGSGSLLTGAGISWQHLKYDYSTNKWSAVYSINALGWYSAPLSSSDGSTAFAYGLSLGLLNNMIMIGAAYDTKNNIVLPTIGIGISLNN